MKKNFTFLLLAFLIISGIFSTRSQTTWVRTQYLDNILPAYNDDSLTVGPQQMLRRSDGKIWLLMQVNRDHVTWLYLIDSTGNVLNGRNVAAYGTLHSEDCYSFNLTPDDGCVYFRRHFTYASSVTDDLYRISPNSSIVWHKTYYESIPVTINLLAGIVPTCYGTFLVTFNNDSLVELSSTGNYIRSRVPFDHNGVITCLPDSNFIVNLSSTMTKQDFSGATIWSNNSGQYSIFSENSDLIYAQTPGEVTKINPSNGSAIWTKPIANNYISITSDLGFISISGNNISRYDSSGNLMLSKFLQIGLFNLKGIVEANPNNYITGGCWRYYELMTQNIGYSPLLFSLNSSLNGVIDSTSFYFIGNANDNTNLNFGDDAVYIAAALNNSGSSRDTLLRDFFGYDVFGTDWSGRFQSGINFKYSDFDGNGIIDTTDLRKLYQMYPNYHYGITPHWRSTTQNNLLVPELRFSFENDSISLSDTLKLNVILGSSTNVIDSIYGLSIDMSFIFLNSGSPIFQSCSFPNFVLGDTLSNIYSFYSSRSNTNPLTSLVLCRTNHSNAIVAGDTIATLSYVLPLNSFYTNPITIFANFSAITTGGFPINLNVVSDSLWVFGTTGINRFTKDEIKLFPNPANDQLIFSFDSENINELNIFDDSGRKIFSVNNPGKKYILNVKDFAEGLYYVSSLSSNKISRSKFLVVH